MQRKQQCGTGSTSISNVIAGPTPSQLKGAYFGALVADSLCLGSHYEYDAPKIKKAYGGDIDRFMAPGSICVGGEDQVYPCHLSPSSVSSPRAASGEQMGGETHGVGWGQRNYHPGTTAGDQTDYGEYNVLVLEYLASQAQTKPATPFSIVFFYLFGRID